MSVFADPVTIIISLKYFKLAWVKRVKGLLSWSYDTAVLRIYIYIYMDHEGLRFPESKSSPKSQLPFTVWQYWLGIVNPKNVLRSFLTHSKGCYRLFKNFCLVKFPIKWLTDSLTYLLMSSDRRNSISAAGLLHCFTLLHPKICQLQ